MQAAGFSRANRDLKHNFAIYPARDLDWKILKLDFNPTIHRSPLDLEAAAIGGQRLYFLHRMAKRFQRFRR